MINIFQKVIQVIIQFFNNPLDPVKHCDVYKYAERKCAHIDGPYM